MFINVVFRKCFNDVTLKIEGTCDFVDNNILFQDKDESSLPGSDLDLGDLGVQGGLGQSSDALLDGAEDGSPGIQENRDSLPCIVSSWSVEGGEETDNSFLMFDTQLPLSPEQIQINNNKRIVLS